MKEAELFFAINKHNYGKNVSVRRGIKWSLVKRVRIKGVGPCVPINTKVMRFSDITEADVCVLEHDPKCRSLQGLYKTMVELYPDFDKREMVTLVYYSTPNVINRYPTDLTIGTIVDKSKATGPAKVLKSTPYYKTK